MRWSLFLIPIIIFISVDQASATSDIQASYVGQCAEGHYWSFTGIGAPADQYPMNWPIRGLSYAVPYSACVDCVALGVTEAQYIKLFSPFARAKHRYEDQFTVGGLMIGDPNRFEDAACPPGEDWSIFDADGDQHLNGLDPAPFDIDIPGYLAPLGNAAPVPLQAGQVPIMYRVGEVGKAKLMYDAENLLRLEGKSNLVGYGITREETPTQTAQSVCNEWALLAQPGLFQIWQEMNTDPKGWLMPVYSSGEELTWNEYQSFSFNPVYVMPTNPSSLFGGNYLGNNSGQVVFMKTYLTRHVASRNDGQIRGCRVFMVFELPGGTPTQTGIESGVNWATHPTDPSHRIFTVEVPVIKELNAFLEPDPIFPVLQEPTCNGYMPRSDTFSKVLQDIKGTLSETPIGSTLDLSMSSIGGVCPTWSLPSVLDIGAVDINVQCSPVMQQVIYPVMKGTILLVAAWASFRLSLM